MVTIKMSLWSAKSESDISISAYVLEVLINVLAYIETGT